MNFCYAEGDNQQKIVRIETRSEDFDFESNGQPIEVVVDPNNKILRMSEDLRVSIIARRGIEQMKEAFTPRRSSSLRRR